MTITFSNPMFLRWSRPDIIVIVCICSMVMFSVSCGIVSQDSDNNLPSLESAKLFYEGEVSFNFGRGDSEELNSLPESSILTGISALMYDDAVLDDETVDRVLIKEITKENTENSITAPGKNHTNILLIPVLNGEGVTKSLSNIDRLELDFRIDKSWLTENGYEPSEILVWEHDGRWSRVPTKLISNDDNYYHYVAEVNEIGNVVISGTKAIDILDHEKDLSGLDDKSADEFSTLPRYLPNKKTQFQLEARSVEQIFELKASSFTHNVENKGAKEISHYISLVPKLYSEGELTLEIISRTEMGTRVTRQVCSRWVQMKIGIVINFNCNFQYNSTDKSINTLDLDYNLYWNGVELDK